jgi:general secretion pathway protein B
MSYILDALKKAESERNLGAVPNVYANAPQAVQADDDARWGKILPWSVAALALGLVLIVLAWLQPWRTQPAATAPVATTVAPIVTPAPQPAPTPVAPAEPAPAPVTPSVVATAPVKPADESPQVKPAPTPTPKATAPVVEKKIADAAPAKVEKPIAKAEAKPEPKPDTKAEVKPEVKLEAKADGSDVGTARDLPQAIQSQLPPISVNGYLYDKDPADRSVLMNQKLLREGDTVAPDLVLEKLLPKGAVLNYKGYRYRITF